MFEQKNLNSILGKYSATFLAAIFWSLPSLADIEGTSAWKLIDKSEDRRLIQFSIDLFEILSVASDALRLENIEQTQYKYVVVYEDIEKKQILVGLFPRKIVINETEMRLHSYDVGRHVMVFLNNRTLKLLKVVEYK